jgi:hypothetical protein
MTRILSFLSSTHPVSFEKILPVDRLRLTHIPANRQTPIVNRLSGKCEF